MFRSATLALALVAAANAQGCPPTDITYEDYTSNRGGTNGVCSSNAECGGGSSPGGTCCVLFSYPYCGVPSDCNAYLGCMPEEPVPSNPIPTEEEFKAALELLSVALADVAAAEAAGCPGDSGNIEIASEDGSCPDADAPPPLCFSGSTDECLQNGGCDPNDEECCCVFYTYPYCGKPSDCNEYLSCYDPPPSAEPMETMSIEVLTDEQKMAAFEFLMNAKANAKIAADGCPTTAPTRPPADEAPTTAPTRLPADETSTTAPTTPPADATSTTAPTTPSADVTSSGDSRLATTVVASAATLALGVIMV